MNSQPSPPPPSRTPVLTALVVLLVLAAGGLLAAYPRMLHFSFVFSAYDVGIHLQALWKFSRLAGLLNTIASQRRRAAGKRSSVASEISAESFHHAEWPKVSSTSPREGTIPRKPGLTRYSESHPYMIVLGQ